MAPSAKCLFCLSKFADRSRSIDDHFEGVGLVLKVKVNASGLIHPWSDPFAKGGGNQVLLEDLDAL